MSNNTAEITLLAPGCFSVLAESDTQTQTELAASVIADINHAQALQTNTHCYEQAMLQILGQDADAPGDLPIAQLRYLGDSQHAAPEHCVCAELVHLQADTANARLFPESALQISQDEAIRLVQSVNELVADDGLSLTRMENGHLYFTGMPASQLDTWPAHALASGKVANYLPRQSEAGDWRRLFTEVQMLFHTHPVNEERVANQKLPVNAMWFWGGQHAQTYLPADDTVLIADDSFSRGIATALNVECRNTTEQIFDWSNIQGHSVVVELSVYKAWLSGDTDALKKAKQVLNENWIAPAQRAVADGMLARFMLDGCEGQAIVESTKPPSSNLSSGFSSLKERLATLLGKSSKSSTTKHSS